MQINGVSQSLTVSALSFLDADKRHFLAGMGSSVLLASVFSEDWLLKYRVFKDGSVIHGIRLLNSEDSKENLDKTEIICFGGRRVSVCSINTIQLTFDVTHEFPMISGWVKDVLAVPGDPVLFIIGCAYLRLSFYILSHGKVRLAGSFSKDSMASALLYSLKLVLLKNRGKGNLEIAVFAGTANGKILIWKLDVSTCELGGNLKVRVNVLNYMFPKICWLTPGVQEENLEEYEAHDGVVFSLRFEHRRGMLLSTSDDRSVRLWRFTRQSGIELLSKFYGHRSRVWSSAFINDEYVVSVSETGTTRIFRYNDGEGEQVRTFSEHNCREVIASSELIISGCEDGTIRVRPVRDSIVPRTMEIAFQTGTICNLHFLDFNFVDDPLLLFTLYSRQKGAWDLLCYAANGTASSIKKFDHKIMSIYSVLPPNTTFSYILVGVALAKAQCSLLALDCWGKLIGEKIIDLGMSSIIHKAFLLSPQRECKVISYLVCCDKKKAVEVYSVSEAGHGVAQAEYIQLSVKKLLGIGVRGSSPFDSAAIGLCQRGNEILLLGRYTGSLLVIPQPTMERREDAVDIVCQYHARDTVKHIEFDVKTSTWFSAALDGTMSQFVVSIPEDGDFNKIEINSISSTRHESLLHVLRSSCGNHILVTRKTSTEIRILNEGLDHDITSFKVRNVHDGYSVCLVGGDTRNVIMATSSTNKLMLTTFMEAISFESENKFMQPKFGTAWGGKRLNDGISLNVRESSFLCTVSEDEMIRIYILSDNHGIQQVLCRDASIGPIFSICRIGTGNESFRIATGGSHSRLKTWEFRRQGLCMLGSFSLDAEPFRVIQLHCLKVQAVDDSVMVIASLSSGALKMLVMNGSLSCIKNDLNIEVGSLALSFASIEEILLLSGWSDGKIRLYDVSCCKFRQIQTVNAHQCGVNEIDVILSPMGIYLVASCGSDEQINLYSLDISNENMILSSLCVFKDSFSSIVGVSLRQSMTNLQIISLSLASDIMIHKFDIQDESRNGKGESLSFVPFAITKEKSTIQGVTRLIGMSGIREESRQQ